MQNLGAIIIDISTFVIVVIAVFNIITLLQRSWIIRRRLSDQPGPRGARSSEIIKVGDVRDPVLRWVQSATAPEGSEEGTKLRGDLKRAGFEQPSAPVWYVILRFAFAIGMPILYVATQMQSPKAGQGLGSSAIALALCGFGLIIPRALLDNRINARQDQIEREFPDSLDLMVVCVESGLGIEASFLRVGQEVVKSHPLISQQFLTLTDEMGAGRGRADALRAMADRANVAVIRSFTALLIQTDVLGVSIGQTLRTYSSEMRAHRFLKAEEKALRIPVLMTIPLVTCILPVIVAAVLTPVALDIIRTVLPALKKH